MENFSQQLPNRYINPYETTDPSATRQVVPTLVKSLAVHLTSAACFGHLLSLRNATHGRSTGLLGYIVAFLVFPLLPLVQLLRQLSTALRLFLKKRQMDFRFLISVICGVKVAASRGSKTVECLAKADRNMLRRIRGPYNYVWLGRVVVLVVLLAQYTGTIVLWCRRASRAHYVRVWQIDTRNLEMAFGGLLTVLFSLAISFLNVRWEKDEVPLDDIQLPAILQTVLQSQTQRTISADAAIDTGLYMRGAVDISNQSSDSPRRLSTFCARYLLVLKYWKDLYVRFRTLNARMSDATLRVFISIFIIPFDSAHAYVFADIPYSFSPHRIYWRFIDAFYHAGYTPWTYPKTAELVVVLYLIPFALILTDSLIRIIGLSFTRRRCPEWVRKTVLETRFWFRTGRTCLSLPLAMLMFMPLYFQILFIVYDFTAIRLSRQYMSTMNWSDGGALWNDPLAESLFIL